MFSKDAGWLLLNKAFTTLSMRMNRDPLTSTLAGRMAAILATTSSGLTQR